MDIKNLSDEEIVLEITNKDPELYVEIIRRYRDKLSHYLRKFISNPDEIEDVLQVVFIKAYKNLNGFDPRRKFSSWVYRITHNEAINHLKKNKNIRICLDDVEYKIIDESIRMDESVDRKLLRKEIEKIISSLGVKYKEPLILFYFEEKSYEEISDILRIPKSTVGTLISRGKKLMKDNLIDLTKKHERR
ncbi:MAG: RNA polymerase sigma factor [Candidatus Pacebacteria bacterium]|nr:RNA polymerase sigma factor [Candidatus Paceibacterota bacterium]